MMTGKFYNSGDIKGWASAMRGEEYVLYVDENAAGVLTLHARCLKIRCLKSMDVSTAQFWKAQYADDVLMTTPLVLLLAGAGLEYKEDASGLTVDAHGVCTTLRTHGGMEEDLPEAVREMYAVVENSINSFYGSMDAFTEFMRANNIISVMLEVKSPKITPGVKTSKHFLTQFVSVTAFTQWLTGTDKTGVPHGRCDTLMRTSGEFADIVNAWQATHGREPLVVPAEHMDHLAAHSGVAKRWFENYILAPAMTPEEVENMSSLDVARRLLTWASGMVALCGSSADGAKVLASPSVASIVKVCEVLPGWTEALVHTRAQIDGMAIQVCITVQLRASDTASTSTCYREYEHMLPAHATSTCYRENIIPRAHHALVKYNATASCTAR
jgi:hypothetical protein